LAIKKGVKKKEHENLTATNIEKVISLLEAEKPVTKKEACEILNISYNTTRLAKIIEEYKTEKQDKKRKQEANRGKPASTHEVQVVIESFLDGDPIADIASRIFRSAPFVKKIIEDIGVPEKSVSYWEPSMVPEKCVSEKFEVGQIVWSARYGCLVIIRDYYPAHSEFNKQDYDCYQIYVIEAIEEPSAFFPRLTEYGGKYGASAWFDLGSLEHLKAFGIDVYRPYRPTFGKWLRGD
jgi:hypothetical protein